MNKKGLAWIVVEWKIKRIKDIEYGQNVTINTWSRSIDKFYANRDFEIYDSSDNLCTVATSRWVMLNKEKGSIARIDEEMIKDFESKNKEVFEGYTFEKLKIPEDFENEFEYVVLRRDIDVVGHMHNLYYLDLAYEALPEEIYNNVKIDNIRISYRKEIKYKSKVKCKYTFKENKHIVVIKSEDEKVIHAIIEMY